VLGRAQGEEAVGGGGQQALPDAGDLGEGNADVPPGGVGWREAKLGEEGSGGDAPRLEREGHRAIEANGHRGREHGVEG
jgi:hypothetical protein